jgi:acyl-CoA oxidase
MLQGIQEKGQLGCFLLTEQQAGVLSGLIVETTAKYEATPPMRLPASFLTLL